MSNRQQYHQPGCSFDGCERVYYAKDFCRAHYAQIRATSRLWPIKPRGIDPKLTIAERIPIWKANSTTNERGCWLFQGDCDPNEGYAKVTYQGRRIRLHKLVWEHFNGPVPDGLELDHLCRNRNCWNPGADHLEPVTHQVNMQRGITGQLSGAQLRARTHCVNGHEFTPENTYLYTDKAYRECRACHRERARERRAVAKQRILSLGVVNV